MDNYLNIGVIAGILSLLGAGYSIVQIIRSAKAPTHPSPEAAPDADRRQTHLGPISDPDALAGATPTEAGINLSTLVAAIKDLVGAQGSTAMLLQESTHRMVDLLGANLRSSENVSRYMAGATETVAQLASVFSANLDEARRAQEQQFSNYSRIVDSLNANLEISGAAAQQVVGAMEALSRLTSALTSNLNDNRHVQEQLTYAVIELSTAVTQVQSSFQSKTPSPERRSILVPDAALSAYVLNTGAQMTEILRPRAELRLRRERHFASFSDPAQQWSGWWPTSIMLPPSE